MKIIRNIFLILPLLYLTACRDCTVVEDSGNPDQLVKLLDENGNNLWFGDSAIYDPAEAVFTHQTEGEIIATPVEGLGAIRIKFPPVFEGEEIISLQVDSATSYDITYTTLLYNNKCTKVYELSYVKFMGKQVCGVCGSTQFNDDRFVNLRLN